MTTNESQSLPVLRDIAKDAREIQETLRKMRKLSRLLGDDARRLDNRKLDPASDTWRTAVAEARELDALAESLAQQTRRFRERHSMMPARVSVHVGTR